MATLKSPAASILLTIFSLLISSIDAGDSNRVFSPCTDTTVQKSDGFTFGIAFAQRTSFSFNNSLKLSPCDSRLSLSSAQLAVFRPKVDEISLLTVNTSTFLPIAKEAFGGHGSMSKLIP